MENFAFEVAETARALRREFDRRAAALGVTRAQWRVLARLRRRDAIGARHIGPAGGSAGMAVADLPLAESSPYREVVQDHAQGDG